MFVLLWLGFPPHVQKSCLCFSCFYTFWRHCTCSYQCACAAAWTVSRFLTPLCLCDRDDLYARAADLIPTCAETVRIRRSFERKGVQNRRLADLFCRLAELIEAVWRKERDRFRRPAVIRSGAPFTVNCRRCEAELDGGRWADEAPRRECTTCGAPASPSLVATSRSTTPLSSSPVPSPVFAARTHRRRGRVDDRALTPGSSASRCWRTDACFWQFVLRSMLLRMLCFIFCYLPLFFIFSWPASRWGLTLFPLYLSGNIGTCV